MRVLDQKITVVRHKTTTGIRSLGLKLVLLMFFSFGVIMHQSGQSNEFTITPDKTEYLCVDTLVLEAHPAYRPGFRITTIVDNDVQNSNVFELKTPVNTIQLVNNAIFDSCTIVNNDTIFSYTIDSIVPGQYQFRWVDNNQGSQYVIKAIDNGSKNNIIDAVFDSDKKTTSSWYTIKPSDISGESKFNILNSTILNKAITDLGNGFAYLYPTKLEFYSDAEKANPIDIIFNWDGKINPIAVTNSVNFNLPLAQAIPPANISQLCEGDTVQLDANPAASGGDGNYTYSWNTTSSLTALGQNNIANTYAIPKTNLPYEKIELILQVTDGGGTGCSDTSVYSFSLFDQPVLTIDDVNQPVCNVNNSGNTGTTGSVEVSATGGNTDYYSYYYKSVAETDWIGSFSHKTMEAQVIPASYTNYNIRALDNNGCYSEIKDFSIPIPEEIKYSTAKSGDNLCYGDALGAITISNIQGGATPYTYFLLDEGGFEIKEQPANNKVFSNIAGGKYTVRVQDKNGCYEDDDEVFEFANPEELKVDNIDFDNSIVSIRECVGGGVGHLAVEASGGTPFDTDPPYLLAAFQQGETPVYDIYTSSIIDSLPAGAYYINIQDQNGCIAQFDPDNAPNTIGISNYYTQLQFDDSRFSSTAKNPCYGEKMSEIKVSVINPNKDNDIKYTLINEVTGDVEATQTQPAYDASIGEPLQSLTPEVFTDLSAGTYKIIAEYETAGCPVEKTGIVIAETDSIKLNTVDSVDITGCYGNSNGSISISYSGGNPNYEYKLYKDNSSLPLQEGSGAAGKKVSFSNLSAGQYTLQVADQKDCPISNANIVAPITLEEPEKIVFGEIESVNITSCYGEKEGNITLNNVSGGTPPYAYRYVEKGKFIVSSFQDNLSAGNYELQIRDANKCLSESKSLTLTQPNQLILDPVEAADITNIESCSGLEAGGVILRAAGGTVPLYYILASTTTGDIDTSDAKSDFPDYLSHYYTDLPAGTYTPKVVDENGCESTQKNITITEPAPIEFRSLSHTDIKNCYGDKTGTISMRATGGPTGFVAEYYVTSKTVNSIINTTETKVSNLAAGEYLVQIKNLHDVTCASETETVTILQPDEIEVDTKSTDISKCFGNSTGSIVLTASGGTPGYQYSIDNGATMSEISSYKNIPGGDYDIVVKDANNCTYNETITLEQPEELKFADEAFSISIGTEVKDPEDTEAAIYEIPYGVTDASITINEPQGGTVSSTTGGYTYTLNNGSVQLSGSFSGLKDGTYNFHMEDDNGCPLDTTIKLIYEPKFEIIPINVTYITGCADDNEGKFEFTIDGDPEGNLSYSYKKGDAIEIETITTNAIENLEAGEYHVIFIDGADYKTDTVSFEITSPDLLELDSAYISKDLKCFGDSNAVITVVAHGGTPLSGAIPYRYSLEMNKETIDSPDSVFSGLPSGNYPVTVTDNNGCSVEKSVLIKDPSVLKMGNPEKTPITSCYGYPDGQLIMHASGGEPPYKYSLNGRSFPYTDTIKNLVGDERYTFAVRDKNGCIDIGKVDSLSQPAQIQFTVVRKNMSCFNTEDGEISIDSLTGGIADFILQLSLAGETWSHTGVSSKNVRNKNFTNLKPGAYNFVITDSKKCFETRTIKLTKPPALRIDTLIRLSPRCDKDEYTGYVIAKAKGGYSPYNYSLFKRSGSADSIGKIYTQARPDDEYFDYRPCDDAIGEYCGVNPGYYRIEIKDAELCTIDSVFQVLPSRFSCLEIFNAFSPNSDGVNDTWEIKRLDDYPGATVKIFDSWGKLLHTFHINDEAWDGRYKNKDMPIDTYYYIIDPGPDYEKYTGAFYLLR